jgi:hypothetical protein
MCCLRFNADVLLANIYGSPSYKKDMEIDIYDLLEDYCGHLNSILPGYKFYNKSEKDIEDFVLKYHSIFKWKDEKNRRILQAEEGIFKPDYFNQNYPEDMGEKLEFAADICLSDLSKKRQKNEEEVLMPT